MADINSDLDSDYEATLKRPKRTKKPGPGSKPPKRPRHKAALRVSPSPSARPSLQQQPSRGTSREASPRPVEKVTEGNLGISSEDLYDAVCSGKTAIVTLVDEWLDSYKQSREEGLLVLINFIVLSCGCKGVVSREMLDSMENADIIKRLTQEFNEDSGNYPLCTPGPQLKRFKAGLCEFAQVLVRSCRNGLIYDEYLFPSLLSLLTGLSDSPVRAFRHTSTLLAMKFMTGIMEVAVTVSVQLQTTKRLYNMEISKSAEDRGSGRLEELQASVSEELENQEEISSMMNNTFRGVFVHRYRDILMEIRAVCIEELGIWLKTDPEDFLNDGCLKYLGWTLHDKESSVRLKCVRALQGLYQEEEFIGRLELFTSRFRDRMLSMVLDKDMGVVMEVLHLLRLIHQRTEEGLSEEECGNIYPLVYATPRGVASAAGVFLFDKLKNVITSEKEERENSDHATFIEILTSFYIQSEFHEHAAYLVDSLWTVAEKELKDWDSMTTLLLQEEGLMCEEEGALIDLMICVIRQAALATPPAGRTTGKKVQSIKDKKIQEKDRRRITTHFIPLLPQLLAKYSEDASKVSLLLKAPLCFDLEMYSSAPNLGKHLDQLLSQICRIVEKHTEDSVLEACAHLVCAFCSDSYTFSSKVHLAFSRLLDGLTECFSSYLTDLLQGSADEDEVYAAASALKRIAALSSAKDTTSWKLLDSSMELLKSRIESADYDKELMVPALKCAAFHLMWARVNAVKFTPAESDLRRLKKDVRFFCRVCEVCLSLNQAEVRDQAFELLCDLLLLYGTSLSRSQPSLKTLVHLPSETLCSEMAAFILDHVFSDEDDIDLEVEMTITVLQRKRNHLAGYCKLVIYGVLDLSAATDIFKHYSKYFKDFGDIIKETISKSKLISTVQSAKTVCLCLQQLFSEMLLEEPSRRDLAGIRELAKKLAMNFGISLQLIRKPMVALHMGGIRFAFREPQEGEEKFPNVTFLQILSDFSFKLLPQDRTLLTGFLKSECPAAALSWPAVRMYLSSLDGRSSVPTEQEDVPSSDIPEAKRRRTTAPGSASSIVRGPWMGSSSIDSSLRTPALTSTVQRRPTKQSTPSQPPAPESDAGSGLTEPESEDDFSAGFPMRKVKPVKRQQLSTGKAAFALDQQDLNSHLNLLSLIEDEDEEIEDYESDFETESGYTLPSTRQTSASILDELFD